MKLSLIPSWLFPPCLKDSALGGHIFVGDRVTQINEYPISDKTSWDLAFRDMYEKNFTPRSVCTPRENFNAKHSSNLGCCSELYDGALQCWNTISTKDDEGRDRFCFAASKIVSSTATYCAADSDCEASVRMALPASVGIALTSYCVISSSQFVLGRYFLPEI